MIVVRTILIALLPLILNSCGDSSQDPPVLPFSTRAQDYLWTGGIGSTWEYLYTEYSVDTNGVQVRSYEDGMTIRYTLLDTGVVRDGVSNLAILYRENIIRGVRDDTDTIFLCSDSGRVDWYHFPYGRPSGYETRLADPIVSGASFPLYSGNAEFKGYIDEVDIQVQTPAGLFRCVRVRTRDSQTLSDGKVRTNSTEETLSPWNLFVKMKITKSTKMPSGKTELEEEALVLVKTNVIR